MSLVFAFSLSVFLSYFIFDAIAHRRGKTMPSEYKLVTVISLSAILLVVSDVLYHRSVTNIIAYEMIISILPMLAVMKLDVKWDEALHYSLGILCFAVVVVLLRMVVPFNRRWVSVIWALLPSVISVASVVVLCWDLLRSISDKEHFRKAVSMPLYAGAALDVVYFSCLLTILVIMDFSSGLVGVCSILVFLICMGCILVLFFCCCYRITSGRIFVFARNRESKLKELIERCTLEAKENNRDYSYREIYDRVVVYFEKDKPYLDPGINVDDVAKKTFCNRLYLSRAINMFSGRNFCQYVNYYRVRYALKVFEEDKELKMQQWAEMSGFRTIASFNMAFRLYMNESPGDWSRRVKGAIPRIRSKKMLID